MTEVIRAAEARIGDQIMTGAGWGEVVKLTPGVGLRHIILTLLTTYGRVARSYDRDHLLLISRTRVPAPEGVEAVPIGGRR